MNQTTLLLIAFVGVTAAAVLLQTFLLAGMYKASRRASERMEVLSTHVNEQVLPLLEKVRGIVDDSAPGIRMAVTNLAETSTLIRAQAGKIDEQADRISDTITEIVGITRSQARQADILATRTMQRVDLTAAAVQHAVLSPVRRLSAVLEGVTAGVGTFVGGRKEEPQAKAVPSDDMFI